MDPQHTSVDSCVSHSRCLNLLYNSGLQNTQWAHNIQVWTPVYPVFSHSRCLNLVYNSGLQNTQWAHNIQVWTPTGVFYHGVLDYTVRGVKKQLTRNMGIVEQGKHG